MHRKALLILLSAALCLPARSQMAALPYYSDPALSPSGAEIAFVSGGDIWTVPSEGGTARLLLAHPSTESRPLYSPDGKSLAFNSSRTGNGDVYLLQLETGTVTRLTWDDAADELSGWSGDGRYVYFSSTGRDIAGMRDNFRVKATGGTPMAVNDHRFVNEFSAAPAPDGSAIAFAARGFGSHQWWRHGSSHLDESEIWLQRGSTYTQLAGRGSRKLWPMWGPDSKTVYYISDSTGNENLWAHPLGGAPRRLTAFTAGRMLWPTIDKSGQRIAFERDFAIWMYRASEGKAAPVAITLRGASATPPVERARLTAGFTDLALSPDGKKLGFVVRGDVFVAAAKEGGDATRVTATAGSESTPVWASNSNVLYYIGVRGGSARIYAYNFLTAEESALTEGGEDIAAPELSPDGRRLAYVRNGTELRVLQLDTKKDALLSEVLMSRPPFVAQRAVTWSPDGRWIAYGGYGSKALYNVFVVPATGGTARPVSFLGNAFGGAVQWTADGRSLLFTTGQRTENGHVARVDLVPQQPRFREDAFRDLFTQPAPATAPAAAKKTSAIDSMDSKAAARGSAVRIVWEGLQGRVSLLPVQADVGDMVLSKDGKTLVLLAAGAGQENLYAYSLDELSRDAGTLRPLTTSGGGKSDLQFSSDGKEVFFLEAGRIQTVALEGKTVKPLSVTAEMEIDFAREKMTLFEQAWELQHRWFYDPGFHGVDWKAVRERFAPYAAGAQTPDELRRLLNLMVGELNASHSGVGGNTAAQFTVGKLGLRFDPAVYEKEGRLLISEVVALGPAAITEEIAVGQYLVAVDGRKITEATNLDALLDGKVGRKVVLTVSSSGSGGREVTVRPVGTQVEKGLLYKQWVQEQRAYVHKASGGRLGYVHMFDMSQGALDQLYLDMDAENHAREGVVVDLRNNNGGFVNAYALDVFARKGYMTMQRRGLPAAPARTQLGQRALEAPTVLVVNQHSLSDAEDFTEGYRALGLGKVVGEPTAGWIIYTSNMPLMDGSTIRLPFIKITDGKGNNMELSPRPVDIAVTNPLGDGDRDRQLDRAVAELLKQLGKGKG